MNNFIKGLFGFIGGAILWILTSLVEAIIEGLGGPRSQLGWAFMFLGFFIMVGFPLFYWIVFPIKNLLSSRKRKEKIVKYETETKQESSIYCPRCGRENRKDAIFCWKCRIKLK